MLIGLNIAQAFLIFSGRMADHYQNEYLASWQSAFNDLSEASLPYFAGRSSEELEGEFAQRGLDKKLRRHVGTLHFGAMEFKLDKDGRIEKLQGAWERH